ncbi:cyclic nucleotide-binding domain-containing protein [Rhizobium tumorigenes]|uniref:Mechanosensitive ion channel family protein n=1 Tax=Rhizobium tumorigenes TaxID=2041385 RepID=A0AAF1K478_9HYPH|nr:mechanosensitive ion channel family protein [Rhizobium tumorigenes]WFR94729.1 mechanosensitive ion channel family protein [Rhizobium tumorigenes]
MTFEDIANPVVQFCFVMIVGFVVSRILLRRRQVWRLVAQIALFILLTVVLIHNDIVPYEKAALETSTSVTLRIFTTFAKIVWWINGAWTLVAFVRVFLIFERKPREGRLLQDLVVGVIYMSAGLSIVADVFGVPVGTLLATSGVFAIILGLALQSTLNDLFSGIALNLGRPYSVGDWVVLDDGMQGKVIETNWRATYLLNGTNGLIVIPNSALAKARLTNLSSPDEQHGVTITVRLVPTTAPKFMAEVMRNVLLSSNSILANPAPSVSIDALDSQAVQLGLSFSVKNIAVTTTAKNEIFDLIYRHVKSSGYRMAPPVGSGIYGDAEALADTDKVHKISTPLSLLSNIPLFAPLTPEEKEALAGQMTRRTYRKDTVIAAQDSQLSALMIVRTGVVSITRSEDGREIELTRLAPGDCFGEGGVLMGANEVGSIRALTFVVIYELGQEHLSPLLKDRPMIAEELGQIMSQRIDAEKHLFAGGSAIGNAQGGSLATRIRNLFQLPHD